MANDSSWQAVSHVDLDSVADRQREKAVEEGLVVGLRGGGLEAPGPAQAVVQVVDATLDRAALERHNVLGKRPGLVGEDVLDQRKLL